MNLHYLKLFEDLESDDDDDNKVNNPEHFSYTKEDMEDFVLELLDEGFSLEEDYSFEKLYFEEGFEDRYDYHPREDEGCYPGYSLKLDRIRKVFNEEDSDLVFRGYDRFNHFSKNMKIFLDCLDGVVNRLQSQVGPVEVDLGEGDFGESVHICVYERDKKIQPSNRSKNWPIFLDKINELCYRYLGDLRYEWIESNKKNGEIVLKYYDKKFDFSKFDRDILKLTSGKSKKRNDLFSQLLAFDFKVERDEKKKTIIFKVANLDDDIL